MERAAIRVDLVGVVCLRGAAEKGKAKLALPVLNLLVVFVVGDRIDG